MENRFFLKEFHLDLIFLVRIYRYILVKIKIFFLGKH